MPRFTRIQIVYCLFFCLSVYGTNNECISNLRELGESIQNFRSVIRQVRKSTINGRPTSVPHLEQVRLSEELSKKIESLLKEERVHYRAYRTRFGRRLEIQSGSNTALNRLAKGLKKVYGTRLVLAPPLQMIKEDFGALWDFDQNTLTLSLQSILHWNPASKRPLSVVSITQSEVHELRHLKTDFRNLDGKSPLLSFGIFPASDQKLHKEYYAYRNGFYLDEVRTFALDLYVGSRLLRELEGKPYPPAAKIKEAIGALESKREILDLSYAKIMARASKDLTVFLSTRPSHDEMENADFLSFENAVTVSNPGKFEIAIFELARPSRPKEIVLELEWGGLVVSYPVYGLKEKRQMQSLLKRSPGSATQRLEFEDFIRSFTLPSIKEGVKLLTQSANRLKELSVSLKDLEAQIKSRDSKNTEKALKRVTSAFRDLSTLGHVENTAPEP